MVSQMNPFSWAAWQQKPEPWVRKEMTRPHLKSSTFLPLKSPMNSILYTVIPKIPKKVWLTNYNIAGNEVTKKE